MHPYLRRFIATLILTAPLSLAALSALSGANESASASLSATLLITVAFAIAVLNAYLAFVRPWLHSRAHNGSMADFKHISGLPLVGSISGAIAVLLSWGHTPTAACAALATLLDTSGGFAYLIITWRDQSLWRETP